MTLPGTIWITGTTCASTRGDLRAGGVDNFPNGGEGDVTSIDIGEEAAAVAGKRRETKSTALRHGRVNLRRR